MNKLIYYLLLLVTIILIIKYNYNKESYQQQTSNKKLAFCFLIYDVINNEELWHRFFENTDPSKYNIYIHYKTDKPLKYFNKYKLKHTIPTKWDSTVDLNYV